MRVPHTLPVLLISLVGCLAIPQAAAADETPTRAQTKEALNAAAGALDGNDVTTGRELTPLLARLAAGRLTLGAADRRKARTLLARPTDGAADPQASGYTVSEEAPFCTTNFCVHYVTTTPDAANLADADSDSVPDVVETIAGEMQNTVRAKENGAGQLNWRAPVSDGTRGSGNGKTDIYLKQLGSTDPTMGSLFGYAAPEVTNATIDDPDQPAYLVIDNDFAPAEYGGRNADKSRQATEAHEYNHVLQFGYDWLQDTWMAESTATWMENQVYPSVDDYVNYLSTALRAWGACLGTPLTTFDSAGGPCSLKVYGSAVWNHWLTNRFGPQAIRRSQEQSVVRGNFAVAAYNNAITNAGGTSFANEFLRFAAATAEWDQSKAPVTPFPDSYPDLPRAASLPVDGAALATQSLDNTTFRLLSITPDPSKPLTRVHADLPAGLGGGVAIVGRKPSGEVTPVYGPAAANGAADASLPNPGDYERITALIVNADATRQGTALNPGFDANTGEWLYAKNAQPFCNVRASSDTTGAGTAAACPVAPTTMQNPPAVAGNQTANPGKPAAAPITPALTFRLSATARQKRSTVLRKGVTLKLRCNRACSARATLSLSRASAKRLKLSRTLGSANTKLSKAGVKTVRVKLGRKARARLRKLRRLAITVTLRTKASTGAAKTTTRKITIVR